MEHLGECEHCEEHGLPAGVPRPPVEPSGDERHHAHERARPQDMYAQPAGEDALAGWVRRSLHDVSFRGLEAQGQAGQPVGHQVHPEDLQRQQRQGHAQEWGYQHDGQLTHIGGDEIFDELTDVVVDGAAFFDCSHDGGEVVVHQHHGSSFFGHIGAGDTHSHADICLLKCRSIVDAVAGHGHNMASILQCLNDLELLLRRDAGVDRDIAYGCVQLLRRQIAEVHPCENVHAPAVHVLLLHDPHLGGDADGGQRLVAGDHGRADTGRFGGEHGLSGLRSGRIDHAHQSHQQHVLFPAGRLFSLILA